MSDIVLGLFVLAGSLALMVPLFNVAGRLFIRFMSMRVSEEDKSKARALDVEIHWSK